MNRHEPAILAGVGTLTLIDGLTFAISDANGDIGHGLNGLIADDTRHLSRLTVSVDGAPVHSLGTALLDPASARFRGFVAPAPGYPDAPLEVHRRRRVRAGRLEDDLQLQWWAEAPARVAVRVEVAADFLDIFQMRGLETGPTTASARLSSEPTSDGVRFGDDATGLATLVRFHPAPHGWEDGVAQWSPALRRGRGWRLEITVQAESPTGPMVVPDTPRSAAARALEGLAMRTEPPDLARACRRSVADLNALSLPDGLDPPDAWWPRGSPGSWRSSAATA